MPPKLNKPFKIRETGPKRTVGTRKGNKILNNKEIIDALLDLSKTQIKMFHEDSQKRFSIYKQMSYKSDGVHTQRAFILEVNNKLGTKRYYIKEEKISREKTDQFTLSYTWEDAITESKALNIITEYLKEHKESGIKTVPFKFGFLDREKGVSYICYDYQYGHHPETLEHRKEISVTEYTGINRKLREFETRVNEYLKRNYKKFGVEPGTTISDISPENCFYDPKTKRIRIFNPVLLKE
ncbi:MAG: hypothetical protein WCX82_02165 [archaeon]|jgi:hypothetical protein